MAASGAAGASTSTPAPPPPSTLARTSPPPSTLDASRISAPSSTLARTSSPPSTLDSSRGQVMDGGEPLMHTDGGGASLMHDACVGRVGGQGIGEPEMRADDGGGDDPQMCGDGTGGKRQQTSQCKNTGGKDKQQKVDKANAKTNKKVLPFKEKYQKVDKVNEKKVDKANEKTEKQVGEAKLRSEKSRNNSASQGVPSPIQLTSSPGVNYIVRAATVKKEALKRANMGGSPSTSQRDLIWIDVNTGT